MAKRGRKVQHRYTKQQLTKDQVIKAAASLAHVFDALQEIVAEKEKLEEQVATLSKERDTLKEALDAASNLSQDRMREMVRELAINTVREAMSSVAKDLQQAAA